MSTHGDLSETDYDRIDLEADGLSVSLGYEDSVAFLRIWTEDIPVANAFVVTGIQINRLRGMLTALGFEPV